MDDLLDLNWSSPSSNSAPKPLAPSLQPSKPKSAAGASSFDFLSKSNTGTSSTGRSNAGTPNYYQSTTPRTTTPLAPAQAASLPKAQSAVIGDGGDAFSSLLGMGSSSGSSKNLTMAQKQAQIVEERRLQEEREKAQFAGLGNWEQLGSSSNTSSSSNRMAAPLQPVPTKSSNAFDGLLQPTISRPSSSSSRITTPAPVKGSGKGTFWDNDDFLAGPSKSSPSGSSKPSPQIQSPAKVADPWDFDQLAAVEPVRLNGNGNGHKSSGMRTPDPDFDFGEWKDMDGVGQSSRSSPAPTARQEPISRRAKPTRSSSPPPHIVGQIVEMGFSPAQARTALARTSTGVDVQAALDGLLGEAFGSREPADALGEDEDFVERERIRRENEDKEERRRRRRQGPSRDTIAPRSRDERERDNERSQAGTPIQADQILAQATEIGQSVFTKATSLWNTGKEKALKAYEEQKKVYEAQLAAGGGGKERGKGPVRDGRPRWMIEAEAETGREEIGGAEAGLEKDTEFRDDSDEEEEVSRPLPRTNGNGNGNGHEGGASRPSRGQERQAQAVREESLFGDDPLPPRSTHRRPEPPKSRPAPVVRKATPPAPLPTRKLVPADASALSSSSNHKSKGNEHFKLGRFTEAESSYSTAISILPNGHLHLIPLYNNRAATRIKLGESSAAAQDSTSVIEIIGLSYHPSKEAPLPPSFAEIKLADAFVKAYTKRAQAWEMGEKWIKAVEDWEKVLGFDAAMLGASGVQTRNLAAEGLRRSKQMLDSPAPSTSTSISTSKPASKPPKPANRSKPAQVERSEAVSTLRAAAKVQEQEDQQRLQLKDTTEARINTWKQGKETNLRALLASLDTVLWDEVLAGGLKVGMHELITEKQVKIKYMKVIARLHPDKLDVKKTTVEQRMLANGAFGTLNEAWQAFNNA